MHSCPAPWKSPSAENERVHFECLQLLWACFLPQTSSTTSRHACLPGPVLKHRDILMQLELFKGAPCMSLTPPFFIPIGPFFSLGEEPGSLTVSSFCVTGALSYIIKTQSRYLSTTSAAPQVCLCLCKDGETSSFLWHHNRWQASRQDCNGGKIIYETAYGHCTRVPSSICDNIQSFIYNILQACMSVC